MNLRLTAAVGIVVSSGTTRHSGSRVLALRMWAIKPLLGEVLLQARLHIGRVLLAEAPRGNRRRAQACDLWLVPC